VLWVKLPVLTLNIIVHVFSVLNLGHSGCCATNPMVLVGSGKLLLFLTSTVSLGFGSWLDPWLYFCSYQDLTCFEIEPSIQPEVGFDYYWQTNLPWSGELLKLLPVVASTVILGPMWLDHILLSWLWICGIVSCCKKWMCDCSLKCI
jgi:hypothetical protein